MIVIGDVVIRWLLLLLLHEEVVTPLSKPKGGRNAATAITILSRLATLRGGTSPRIFPCRRRGVEAKKKAVA